MPRSTLHTPVAASARSSASDAFGIICAEGYPLVGNTPGRDKGDRAARSGFDARVTSTSRVFGAISATEGLWQACLPHRWEACWAERLMRQTGKRRTVGSLASPSTSEGSPPPSPPLGPMEILVSPCCRAVQGKPAWSAFDSFLLYTSSTGRKEPRVLGIQ